MRKDRISSFPSHAFAAARGFVLASFCFLGSQLPAQIADRVPDPVQISPQKLNLDELGRLLSSIALYPDALIALILPASTVPADIVLAARYLQANGDPDLAGDQPWDESVKSLVRYPEVLAWMDKNLEWTSSVGEAFVDQPADVMASIQALREQARAAGNLMDTPEQRVVAEDDTIRIVPADPQVIFVPQYDSQIVFVQTYSPAPLLTFGVGFPVGTWLSYDFDWSRHCIYRGRWRGWNHDSISHGPNGNREGNPVRVLNIDASHASRWQPSVSSQRQTAQRQLNNNGNARYVGARSNASSQPQLLPQNAGYGTVQPGRSNAARAISLPSPSRLEISPARQPASTPPAAERINRSAVPTPQASRNGEHADRALTTPDQQVPTTRQTPSARPFTMPSQRIPTAQATPDVNISRQPAAAPTPYRESPATRVPATSR
ncbi:MAG: DUF3300 domain-containing protein [Verrucomicrobiae bacterium]